jgi:fucose permease
MNRAVVAAGFAVLLTSAYMDNIRGPLLPVFQNQLSLSYTQAGLFLIMAYPLGVAVNILLNPLFNRYGIKNIAFGICGFGLFANLFANFVDSYPTLLGFGLILGAATSTFGALCNILVMHGASIVHRTRSLCGLHMMYGIGSFFAPVAVAEIVGREWPWASTLWVWPPLLIGLSVLLLTRMREDHSPQARLQSSRLSGPQWLGVMAITTYVGGEVVTSLWLTTYLTNVEGMEISDASWYLSAFFLCMFVVRFLGFILIKPHYERFAYWFALLVGMGGLGVGYWGVPIGFAVAGMMGLFFPVFLSRISQVFESQWRSVTLWVLVAMQTSLFALNYLVGNLADLWSLKTIFYLPLGMLGLCAGLVLVFERWQKKGLAQCEAQISG